MAVLTTLNITEKNANNSLSGSTCTDNKQALG